MLTRSQEQSAGSTASTDPAEVLPDGQQLLAVDSQSSPPLSQQDRDVFTLRFTHMETLMATLTHTVASLSQALLARDASADAGASTIVAPVSPVTGGLINATKAPSSPPRFRDDGHTHPMEFLASVERYLGETATPDHTWVREAITFLDGMPRDWGSAFEDSWTQWEGFRSAFTDMFWSEERQERVIDDLHNGSFNKRLHNSLTEFFVHWMQRVKHLSPPMSPRTFLRRITHLFPANVENVVLAARVSTAEEMLSLLRDLDDAATRRQERTLTSTSDRQPQTQHQSQGRHQKHQGRPYVNQIASARGTSGARDDGVGDRAEQHGDAGVDGVRRTSGNGN